MWNSGISAVFSAEKKNWNYRKFLVYGFCFYNSYNLLKSKEKLQHPQWFRVWSRSLAPPFPHLDIISYLEYSPSSAEWENLNLAGSSLFYFHPEFKPGIRLVSDRKETQKMQMLPIFDLRFDQILFSCCWHCQGHQECSCSCAKDFIAGAAPWGLRWKTQSLNQWD